MAKWSEMRQRHWFLVYWRVSKQETIILSCTKYCWGNVGVDKSGRDVMAALTRLAFVVQYITLLHNGTYT